ncbi:MAG: T9SS type A sorting domain-containing protein [Bacteroidales bacterium]|nr:T9SS type A sorting domain-containing protein [Bacteroidales bacterium]
MKKTLLFTLALLLSVTMFAQNRATLINETFDGETLPSGWTINGLGSDNWSIASSNKAGGAANELLLYWNPQFNGVSRFVSPALDLTNVESLAVSFKHYFDNYGGTSAIGIATSSDGINWNSAWEQNYSTSGQYSVSEIISTTDMGKNNVKICIYFSGNSYNINNWYFDDIEVFTLENLDLRLVSVDIPTIMDKGQLDITFTVQNIGKTTIESFEAETENVGDGFCGTMSPETFTANLAPMEKKQFTFSESITLNPGTYSIPVNIISVNNTSDDDQSNNFLSKKLYVAMGNTNRIPMIEHFSSSTCGPCVSVNYAMNQLTANYPGQFSYVKYQMNWPGNGDPYYTEEGGTRRFYYGVDGVPMAFLDGASQGYAAVTENNLIQSLETPAYADVRGAFNVEGNTINVTADFMSYVQMENVRAFIAINEKVTTGNVGSNGETEFHHVMMKMLDGANGNEMSINAGEYQRLEFSFDMSSTNVEDMNDLEVALWLQDYNSKEVYNSHFAYEYTEHAYPVKNMTANLTETSLEASWEVETGNPTGYNIYIDGQLVETNYTGLSYVNEEIVESIYDDKDHSIEVVALYENGKTSVGVVKKIASGVNVTEIKESNLNIYPNPVKDVVSVNSENINSVSVYNSVGVLVEKIEVRSNNVEINMSDYNTGIYFVQVNTENGTATRKVVKL